MIGGDLPGTVARVNKVLKSMGVEERIAQGNGYVYFYDGDTSYWPAASVFINRINEMTVKELISEYEALKAADRDHQPRNKTMSNAKRIQAAATRVNASQEQLESIVQAELERFPALGFDDAHVDDETGEAVFDLYPPGSTDGVLNIKAMDYIVKAVNLAGSKMGSTLDAGVLYNEAEDMFQLFVKKT